MKDKLKKYWKKCLLAAGGIIVIGAGVYMLAPSENDNVKTGGKAVQEDVQENIETESNPVTVTVED